MANPVIGAWQWLGDLDPQTGELIGVYTGRLLITETHFCAVFGRKDRPAPQGDQPTEAEAAALFRSIPGVMAASHTLSKNGETLKGSAIVSAHPRGVGASWHRVSWVVGDLMYGQGISGDGTRGPVQVYLRRSEPGTSALAGTWELVSEEWDGMMLMTDTQYRYVITRKDRPNITARASELSDADTALLYHSFDAQGGSYTVSGSNMTRRPELARDPREQGQEIPVEFKIDGQKLTTLTPQGELGWRKLE